MGKGREKEGERLPSLQLAQAMGEGAAAEEKEGWCGADGRCGAILDPHNSWRKPCSTAQRPCE